MKRVALMIFAVLAWFVFFSGTAYALEVILAEKDLKKSEVVSRVEKGEDALTILNEFIDNLLKEAMKQPCVVDLMKAGKNPKFKVLRQAKSEDIITLFVITEDCEAEL